MILPPVPATLTSGRSFRRRLALIILLPVLPRRAATRIIVPALPIVPIPEARRAMSLPLRPPFLARAITGGRSRGVPAEAETVIGGALRGVGEDCVCGDDETEALCADCFGDVELAVAGVVGVVEFYELVVAGFGVGGLLVAAEDLVGCGTGVGGPPGVVFAV